MKDTGFQYSEYDGIRADDRALLKYAIKCIEMFLSHTQNNMQVHGLNERAKEIIEHAKERGIG